MGLAMTFKQTQGIFAFLAIVLFVIVMTPPRAGPATHAARARQWAGGVRILALGGTLAFAVAYVAPHLATVSAILMLAPLAVLVAGLVVREMAGWPPHDPAIAGLGPIALVSVGAAIPVLAYVALYWRIGALAAFVHDTMVGLPQQIAWFVPLRQPELATVCLTATIFVRPVTSKTLVPSASSSTSSPIRTRPSGVLTGASYGWHALACCGTPRTPMLNQTGELNAARWSKRMNFNSLRNAAPSASSRK